MAEQDEVVEEIEEREEFDEEAYFDEQIAPLLDVVRLACNAKAMPFVANTVFTRKEGKIGVSTACNLPKNSPEELMLCRLLVEQPIHPIALRGMLEFLGFNVMITEMVTRGLGTTQAVAVSLPVLVARLQHAMQEEVASLREETGEEVEGFPGTGSSELN